MYYSFNQAESEYWRNATDRVSREKSMEIEIEKNLGET